MLKKPHNLFYSIEDNNYYLLQTNDVTFLVTESVLKYRKGLFKKEFTTAIKMLPLTSAILMLLASFAKLDVLEEVDKGGLENELLYPILDVKKVREDLRKIVDELELENHQFDYRKPVHNEALLRLLDEGFQLLATEPLGTYMRRQWLARSDKNGVIRIVEATLGGKPSMAKVVDIKFHTLNKNIVDELLKRLEKETDGK